MFQIVSFKSYNRTVHHVFLNFAEAEAFAKTNYKILDYVKDDLADYDCADFITQSGKIYQIQPAH